jgi:hypothetical protein
MTVPADMLAAAEAVHRSDPYVARDGYRCPYVLDEEYAAHDLMLLDRRREHRPPVCWECSQAEWLAAGQPAAQPCKQCSRLYRGRCVRCPICGYWKRLL